MLLNRRLVGEAEMEKSGVVTVTVMLAVWVSPRVESLPWTTTVYFPARAFDGTLIVNVDVLLPPVGIISGFVPSCGGFHPVGAVNVSCTLPL